jgi:hypothetical protein
MTHTRKNQKLLKHSKHSKHDTEEYFTKIQQKHKNLTIKRIQINGAKQRHSRK